MRIECTFPLSRLEATTNNTDAEPDVRVVLDEAPQRLNQATAGLRWEINSREALLDVANVGRIWVKPREIVVDPLPQVTLADLSFGVLAAAMPPLLFLRRTLVLHAAAVRWGGGAVAIGGGSGVGKSTTLFACLRRGGGFVTDDIAALQFSGSPARLSIQPGPPGISLWPDALDYYTLAQDNLEPVRSAAVKRIVPSRGVAPTPSPLSAVVVLSASSEKTVRCARVSGRAAFNALRSLLYGPRMMEAIDRPSAFHQVAAAANQVPTFVLHRPDGGYDVEGVADAILSVAQ